MIGILARIFASSGARIESFWRDYFEATLILIICLLGYAYYQDKLDGRTYIEYSYRGKDCVREVDYIYWDKKLEYDDQTVEIVMEIESQLKREDVVIRNRWIMKHREKSTFGKSRKIQEKQN
jgi:hypothetical protein